MKRPNFLSIITEKTYNSIEFLPIWNWNEILKTGDLNYLLKSKGLIKVKKTELSDLWDYLQDEYIGEFGLDEKFKKKLKLLKEKARLNYEFILTKDRFINTELAIIDADLQDLESDRSISFYELKDHLEKYKGFRIDTKTTTVTEWHYALKNMSNG